MIDRIISEAKVPGLYMITWESGKIYYGENINIFARLRHHESKLRLDKHDNMALQNDWNLYGDNDRKPFEFICLIANKSWSNVDERREMEILYIKGRPPEKVYNTKRAIKKIANTSSIPNRLLSQTISLNRLSCLTARRLLT